MNELADLLKQLAAGRLPRDLPADNPCVEETAELVAYLREITDFVRAISAGDLSAKLTVGGALAGNLKGLHANLRHLTWQTQQVAAGDFHRRVDFLGEFSIAFNNMVEKLAENREELVRKNAQLHSAYEKLQQTQVELVQQKTMASVGQLAAGVAHEINNPMGFIASNLRTMGKYLERLQTYIRLLENTLEAGEASHLPDELAAERKRLQIDFTIEDSGYLLAESAEGATRVEEIVRNLKSFSQIDAAEWQTVDINQCLENAIVIASNHIAPEIEIIRNFAEIPHLPCQPSQLNQAFFNLLVNASQALAGTGEIRISTRRQEDNILIEIADNGPGIAADHLGRIFEPFFTTKDVGKGTGLGLRVAYDIVKNHEGEISVESQSGKGTTFSIRVPLRREAAPEKQAEAPPG